MKKLLIAIALMSSTLLAAEDSSAEELHLMPVRFEMLIMSQDHVYLDLPEGEAEVGLLFFADGEWYCSLSESNN